ncbi:DNA mismatch repair protein [Chitinophaga sp. YIM B06452]|uniref:MutS-related protein n=1 Tax=Chitinophaga sp. YIM B06452 TaxID=3082158 RepID=UPI0031FE43E9
MLFTTDNQTLEDLNIFGKHGGDSVYNIFNRCATRGGAAVLEEMFRYPLSDDAAINRRCGIIRYFAGAGMPFPFQSTLFDAAELYLSNTDERTKLSAQEHSVAKKISSIIAPDAETQQVYNGVNALAELLKGAKTFVSALQIQDGHFYAADKNSIAAILSEPAFAAIIESKGKLQHAAIAEFDIVLRFRHREEVHTLLRHIYFLDVYLSIARVAVERGFAFPEALPRGQHVVRLQGVYHPQVKNAVPNNISITPEGNVIFLTGANMAGKSTFMKSLSIAMFLAHMGFPVAAEKMEFSVLDGIYTTINLPDNLGMGASHFYAEVLRVKKMAKELSQGKDLFIVFDELFRGTNVKDAYEATIAITKGFAGKRSSLFVISTHIIEAGEVLKQACPNVRFIYLPTRMNGNHPVYTYTLENGITDDRHGMIIINNEGILGILEAGIKKWNQHELYCR